MKNKKLTRNALQCLVCNDIIESTHVHDFKTCSCGNLSVDGGLEYCKISYKENNSWINLTEYEEDN